MYVARPGIEPRTPDLQVRCPINCAARPGNSAIRLFLDLSHEIGPDFFSYFRLDKSCLINKCI